ncbi:hypothetical protein [Microbacterium sp. A84]|uniref:hypothetical protein n=1 Tax=Microbacterium sp. A84 TaxID=3450715 RepID=UPI003F435CA2
MLGTLPVIDLVALGDYFCRQWRAGYGRPNAGRAPLATRDELNIDVFDESGLFLGCVDMVYPGEKVAIEYLGMLHGESWAQDVERLAALRAAGWTVIEATGPLLKRPAELVRRVSAALGR